MVCEFCHILTSPLSTPHSQLCGDLNIQQPRSLQKPGGWRPMEGAQQGRDGSMRHDLELIPWKYPFFWECLKKIVRGSYLRFLLLVVAEKNQSKQQASRKQSGTGVHMGSEKLWAVSGRLDDDAAAVTSTCPGDLSRPWAFSLGWPWGSVQKERRSQGSVSCKLAGWVWKTCSNRHPEARGQHEGPSHQAFGKKSVQSLAVHEGSTGKHFSGNTWHIQTW